MLLSLWCLLLLVFLVFAKLTFGPFFLLQSVDWLPFFCWQNPCSQLLWLVLAAHYKWKTRSIFWLLDITEVETIQGACSLLDNVWRSAFMDASWHPIAVFWSLHPCLSILACGWHAMSVCFHCLLVGSGIYEGKTLTSFVFGCVSKMRSKYICLWKMYFCLVNYEEWGNRHQ